MAIFYFYFCAFEQLLTSGKFCQVIVPSELTKKKKKPLKTSDGPGMLTHLGEKQKIRLGLTETRLRKSNRTE